MEESLRSKARAGEKSVLALVDPDPSKYRDEIAEILKTYSENGLLDGILVGGSLGVSEVEIARAIELLRKTGLPIILFPGNVNGISPNADAILFMSLLNSADPYYIIGAQVLGAPIVKRYGLEVLPTAYIVIGDGTAVSHVGWVRPIPSDLHDIVAAYALASEFLGMRFIYLEGGSGAAKPVSPEAVKAVRRSTNQYIIVGGGIRSPETALEMVRAGADAIVLGTIIEKDPARALEIIKAVKSYRG